jgi:asparagine synthetase B (glutamine-hydrolysing)
MHETASKPFKGTWVLGSGADKHSVTGSVIHGSPVSSGHAMHTTVEATQHYIRFSRGMPSPVPLYFRFGVKKVVYNEHRATCEFLARCDGLDGKTYSVDAGTEITLFRGPGRGLKMKGGSCDNPYHTPSIRDLTPEQAVSAVKEALLQEVQHWGGSSVGVMLSGGVDSLSVLWALKESGFNVHAVGFGTKDDAYDPYYARKACEHFGIPFHRVEPPTDETELKAFMRKAIMICEQVQGPNVRMGASLLACAQYLNERGVTRSWQGFVADRLLGNKGPCVGQFRRLPEDEQTSEAWRDKRIEFSAIQSPNTDMISKIIRIGGGGHDWRSPFHTPLLWDLLLSLPLSVAPAAQDKRVLRDLMAQQLPEEARGWEVKRKMAFNQGSGFNEFAKENYWASDDGIKELFADVRAHNALK